MKRFYCTICKRIKRVRVMPDSVVTPNADSPSNRIGVCSWHNDRIVRLGNKRQEVGVK